ncbi:MAG: CPBP family intramembrane metalloprotease [Neisseria sp.]|nr:CPBP family intramembrane metalloprotease [Neisseria sp.]
MALLSRKYWLIGEFCVLFLLLPLLFLAGWLPNSAMLPALWAVFLYAALVLTANGARWWRWDFPRGALSGLLQRSLWVAALLCALALVIAQDKFLDFVRRAPAFWLLVMLLYPLLSALPQELVYRRFFFDRYRALFGMGDKAFLVLNAALFSYMHIVFLNPVAVACTFVGGLMFAATYRRSRSLYLTALEHGLYGNLVFTVGLGQYFYHAAVA